MRRITLLCSAVLLMACAKTEDAPPVDTGMAVAPATVPEAAPAPAPIDLKTVAGKYAVTGKNEAGDTTLVTYELDATGDTTGWMLTFPKRKPIPQRVIAVAGDSIVLEAGPYSSEIYKGVQVRTHTVYRLQDGKLVGRTVARYQGGPDSVRIVMSEGIRK
ncbi:MAG TPA: hypothetical protein VM939_11530 [Gemmatimonadaceae bacterium]|nr:hypothetical protein [Gemmatimonadaceae bacterium]